MTEKEATAAKIDRLVLSIAVNQFTVPLPTGKEIVTAVNERDALLARVGELEKALREIRKRHDTVANFHDCQCVDCEVARAALSQSKKG